MPAFIGSVLMRYRLASELNPRTLAGFLALGAVSPDDQKWLAAFFDRSRKTPCQLLVRRRQTGRPRVYPGAKDSALWGPLLHELDTSPLVGLLDAGALAAEDQRWLAELFSPDSDAPVVIEVRAVRGRPRDAERATAQDEIGGVVHRRTRGLKNKKRAIGQLQDETCRSRTTLYEARRVHLDLEDIRQQDLDDDSGN